jgi:hypothetical protein
MKIRVTIKSGSASEKMLKKMIAEKAAFRNAVACGTISTYVKNSGAKFAAPISIK